MHIARLVQHVPGLPLEHTSRLVIAGDGCDAVVQHIVARNASLQLAVTVAAERLRVVFGAAGSRILRLSAAAHRGRTPVHVTGRA